MQKIFITTAKIFVRTGAVYPPYRDHWKVFSSPASLAPFLPTAAQQSVIAASTETRDTTNTSTPR